MSLDSALRSVASNVLDQFGLSVNYVRRTVGKYDPAAGSAGLGESETISSVKARFADALTDELDGTLVQKGDRSLIIAALDLPAGAPDTDDTVEIDGRRYRIVSFHTVYAVSEPVYYLLQLRS